MLFSSSSFFFSRYIVALRSLTVSAQSYVSFFIFSFFALREACWYRIFYEGKIASTRSVCNIMIMFLFISVCFSFTFIYSFFIFGLLWPICSFKTIERERERKNKCFQFRNSLTAFMPESNWLLLVSGLEEISFPRTYVHKISKFRILFQSKGKM